MSGDGTSREVGIGFDLNADPAVATIERLGVASESAAVSADKLAGSGERINTGTRAASTGVTALTRDVLKLNALFSVLQGGTVSTPGIDLGALERAHSETEKLIQDRSRLAETATVLADVEAQAAVVATSALEKERSATIGLTAAMEQREAATQAATASATASAAASEQSTQRLQQEIAALREIGERQRAAAAAATARAAVPPPAVSPISPEASATPLNTDELRAFEAMQRRIWEASDGASAAARREADAMLLLGTEAENVTDRQLRLIQETRAATEATSAHAASVAGLSRAQQDLLGRAERLAAVSETLDVTNKKVVSSYLAEVAEVRALGVQMGVLNQVQTVTARGLTDIGGHVAATSAQMKAMRSELTAVASAEQAGAQSAIYHTRAMALQEIEARKMDAALTASAAAHTQLGTATGLTRGGLNTLRSSVTSLAASLIGSAPGVAQFSGALGTMAVGSGLMIGVLAALAAAAFAWDKLTASVRKSKEEHERAIKVLEDLQKKRDQGPAGETGVSTAVGTKDLQDQIALVRRLEREQAALAKITPTGDEAEGIATEKARVERRLATARAAVINLRDQVALGNQETAKLNKAAADEAAQQDASSLAARLQFNQKDAAARHAALAQLAKDRAEYARLLKLPETSGNSAQIAKVAGEIKQLDDALKGTKAKRDPDASNLQADLRARESIAATDERRLATARALETAAGVSRAEYERVLHTQELLTKQAEEERRIRESFKDVKGNQRPGTEAAMAAEIERARKAIADTDAAEQRTRANLDIGKAEEENAILRAKIQSYDDLGKAAKDSGVEVEYHARITAASAVADETKRQKLIELAEEWRRLQHTVTQKSDDAEAVKKASDEAAHAVERRWREASRVLSSAINGVFTDVLAHKNPFQAIWDNAKAGFFRMVSDIIASKITDKFKEMLGVGPSAAAKKQDEAGLKMVEASKRQLRAAEIMAGVTPSEGDATGERKEPSWLEKLESKMPAWLAKSVEFVKKAAAPALAGFGAGYGVGQSVYSDSHGTTGNYARGALGGAAAGALAGSAFGPVGTAVGAAAGFIGGIVGVNKAMKEAAAATTAAVDAVQKSMASLRATVAHDDLSQAIAQVEIDRAARAKAIEDAWSGGDKNSDRVRWRTQKLAEMNALEDKYIAQLKEEAAAKQRYFTEDLDVRALRAQGKDKAADALDFQHRQDRELDEYRRTHDMSTQENKDQYAYLQWVQAQEANKYATDANTKALNDLTTSVNTVTGFKLDDLNPYIQKFAEGRPLPGTQPINPIPLPVNPFVPPMQPLSPPTLSRSGSSTGTVASAPVQITIAAGAIQVNESKTPQMTAEAVAKIAVSGILTALDKEKNARDGVSGSRVPALDRLKLSPGSIPWPS